MITMKPDAYLTMLALVAMIAVSALLALAIGIHGLLELVRMVIV